MRLCDLFEDHRYKISYYNKDDQRHREDGLAVIRANGTKGWYINDKPHITDGLAII